jgi:predicted aldo/keto reductase-like oxidoreductase
MNWFKPAPSNEEIIRAGKNNGSVNTFGMSSHDTMRVNKLVTDAKRPPANDTSKPPAKR